MGLHLARLAAFVLALAAVPLLAFPARAGSDVPPKGPPWIQDFHEAQTLALKEGKAIFVYLTKTH